MSILIKDSYTVSVKELIDTTEVGPYEQYIYESLDEEKFIAPIAFKSFKEATDFVNQLSKP